jgi:hypothetical protein
MHIKHFTKNAWRSKDPTNPGRSLIAYQWVASGTDAIAHGGDEYAADSNGWFEVPPDVAELYLRMHVTLAAGEQSLWMTEVDAQAQVRAGFMDTSELALGRAVVPPRPQARLVPPRRPGSVVVNAGSTTSQTVPVGQPARPTRARPANRALGDDGAAPPRR